MNILDSLCLHKFLIFQYFNFINFHICSLPPLDKCAVVNFFTCAHLLNYYSMEVCSVISHFINLFTPYKFILILRYASVNIIL